MKRSAALLLLIVLLIALPAQAHDFTGDGDCEGWYVTLDGLYGAHHLYLNGNSVALQLNHFIADTSGSTSTDVTVFWDKASGDVTVTHTLYRQGECTPPTTQPTTTTTVPATTTAPSTTTTTPNSTTTTGTPPPPSSTTTIEQCPPGKIHQPPLCVDPPTEPPAQPPASTPEPSQPVTEDTLPVTGMSADAMVGLGVSLAALGALVLLGTRNRKVEG